MSHPLFLNTQVLICVGSGGVGKTTVAASLAILAAREGKKVLVLTIDPSKRLAQTLGIEGETNIVEVPGQSFPGKLYAGVIDHKKTFDDFVARAAAKTGSVEKILNNRLYQQLSTNLAGSQEFTSLEKLYSAYESKQYDLIILDTPPAKHTLDFLNAPQKLAALFNESVAKWFREPVSGGGGLLGAVLSTGTKQVMKVLEMLTGSSFIKELADFFGSIEKWQDKLQFRIIEVHKMLVSPGTQFCLVTSFDEAQLKEAACLSREVRKGGYHLRAVVLNRAFPEWSLDTQSDAYDESSKALFKKFQTYFQHRQEIYNSFEASLAKEIMCYKLVDLNHDVSSLKTLADISDQFAEKN